MKVGRQKAIEIYIARNRKIEGCINRIASWDDAVTQRENAIVLCMKYNRAAVFKRRWKLKCVKLSQAGRPVLATTPIRIKLFRQLHKEGYSNHEIANVFGVSHQYVQGEIAVLAALEDKAKEGNR